jgi:hypothetical protein
VAGTAISYNAENPEERFSFQIRFTDIAGNSVNQDVNLAVHPPATALPDLAAASDSGALNNDNITNSNSWSITVGSVLTGANVKLFFNGTEVGSQTAAGSSATFTITNFAGINDGNVAVTATQAINGLVSAASTPLTVVRDTSAVAIDSTPGTLAVVGGGFYYDAQHAEEGVANVVYSLLGAPTGATINPATGVLTWTPVIGQLGLNEFQVRLTDAAGNTTTQDLAVTVIEGTLPASPLLPDLDAGSDSGASSSDNITNATSWSIVVGGVDVGATVKLFFGGDLIDSVVASGTSVTFTVDDLTGIADGTIAVTAVQNIGGLDSLPSTALSIVKDTTASGFTSEPILNAKADVPYVYNIEHEEEGHAGFVYEVFEGPAGVSIDPVTGVVSWTPTPSDIGENHTLFQVTDIAGNISFTVSISTLSKMCRRHPTSRIWKRRRTAARPIPTM